MRKYLHNLAMMIMAVATIGTFSSCDKDEPEVLPEPKVSSVEYLADKTTETSVVIEVNFEDADAINYSCYLSSESEGEWETKSVAIDAKSIEITFDDLEAGSAYKAEFYASNGNIQSAKKSVSFTTNETLPVPAVVSATFDKENVSETEAQFEVTCFDATSVKYAYYATADAETAEKNWITVEFEEGATAADVVISELEAETAYTAEFVAVNGEIESEAVAVEFTTAAAIPVPAITALSVVEGTLTDTSATVKVGYAEVTAIKFAHYVTADAETVEKEWNTFPIMVEGSVEVDMPFMALTAETEYTAEFIAINGDIESEAMTINFTTTAPAAPITVELTEITPFTALLTVDIDESVCVGWSYANQETEYYIPSIKDLVNGGYAPELLKEDGTVTIGGSMPLSPAKNYTVEVIGISGFETVESYGSTYEVGVTIGDAVVIEYTTTVPTIGGVDETMNITVTEVTHKSIAVDIERTNLDVSAYYTGFVEASEVANDDIEAWINDTNWIASNYSYTFWDPTSYTVQSNYSYGMKEGTEYLIFVIPLTPEGKLGQVTSIKETTTTLVYRDDVKGALEITPAATSANIKITFEGGASKVYYYNVADNGTYTDETLTNAIISQKDGDYTYWKAEDATDGVLDITIDGLKTSTNYKLATLAVAADGAIGLVNIDNYKTEMASYDSEATVTITLVPESLKLETGYGNAIVADYNVEMGNGAVKYIYGTLDYSAVVNPIPEAFGDALINGWPSTSSDPTQQAYFYTQDRCMVFIPVDADGAFGMPEIIHFTKEEWDAYFPETATDE